MNPVQTTYNKTNNKKTNDKKKQMKKGNIPSNVNEIIEADLVKANNILNKAKEEEVGDINMGDIDGILSSSNNTENILEDIIASSTDVGLAMKVMTKLLKAPNGGKGRLDLHIKDRLLPTSTRATLSNILNAGVKEQYGLEGKLTEIITNTLFKRGSHAFVVIPDIAIEDFILDNRSKYVKGVEQLQQDIVSEFTTEGLSKLPHSKSAIGFEPLLLGLRTTKTAVAFGSESLGLTKAAKMLRKHTNLPSVLGVKDFLKDEGARIGHSLFMSVPSTSIVPVCSKADPSKHLGYICVVDKDGTIINPNRTEYVPKSSYEKLAIKLDPSLQGKLNSLTEEAVSDKVFALYKTRAKDEVANLLSRTDVNGFSTRSDLEFLYESMLSTALAGSDTTILYLDRSNVTYFAVGYKPNGTGKSLLEDLLPLVSMHNALLTASVNGEIENNITTYDAVITLDPKDPEPKRTAKMALAAIHKGRGNKNPLPMIKFADLSNMVTKAGVNVVFKHPKLPDISVDMSDKTANKAIPSDSLMERISDMTIRGIGMPPELIKDLKNTSFAITIDAMDGVLEDTIVELQDTLNLSFIKLAQILYSNDLTVRNEVEKVIKKDITYIMRKLPSKYKDRLKDVPKEELIPLFVEELVNDITLTLPVPLTEDDSADKQAYDDYESKLDDAIDYWLDADAIPETFIKEIGGDLDAVKGFIKAGLVRKWQVDNRYLPDLIDVFSLDGDKKPMLDIVGEFTDYADTLETVLSSGYKDMIKLNKKIEKSTGKLEAGVEEPDPSTEPASTEEETPKDETPTNETAPTDDGGGTSSVEKELGF